MLPALWSLKLNRKQRNYLSGHKKSEVKEVSVNMWQRIILTPKSIHFGKPSWRYKQ